MKRSLNILISSILSCCLAIFALAPLVQAADMHVTGSGAVNLRDNPSTQSSVITSVASGNTVSVLEHDPAGWSKVEAGGAVGFIKSEFLAIPAGAQGVAFKTTAEVNFRTSPSLSASVISSVVSGTSVFVVEHDPAGWSKVRINGTDGYIRSDFLALQIQQPQQAPVSSTQSSTVLKTIDGVNFREGPSTEHRIIAVLEANTSVNVIERDINGWSKVSFNGVEGYIRADLLSVSGLHIELLDWSIVSDLLTAGDTIRCQDVRTGTTFYMKILSIGDHADVEPVAVADTEAIRSTHNGVWSWAARPLWVTFGDRTIAASMHGMPHDISTINDNGMDGHVCMHFLGSTTTSTSESFKADLRNAVQEAWDSR